MASVPSGYTPLQPGGAAYGPPEPKPTPMPRRATPRPGAYSQLLGSFAQIMGGEALSILDLSSGAKDFMLGKDLHMHLTHAYDSTTRIFHRVFYGDEKYSIGVQKSLGQGFLAADIDTSKHFDGRAYYQWNDRVDIKTQCTSTLGKDWEYNLRSRLNYRATDFSCTVELEKPKDEGVTCTLSYVQALTHVFQCGAQMRFDHPLNAVSYALGLRAAHPNGNLSATLDSEGLLQAFFHRPVAHYMSPYIANVQIATGLEVDTKAEEGPAATATLGWCLNMMNTGVQLQGCINNWGQMKLAMTEPVARGVVVSLFGNVSHWYEAKNNGFGPRYEFGMAVRVGPAALQEPAFTRFSAMQP